MQDVFSHLPTLETERLTLRKLTLADAADLYVVCRNKEVSRYVLWYPHHSQEDTRIYIRSILRHYRNDQPAPWGMEYQGRIIGTIGFLDIDWEHRLAEVGYSMAQHCWNKGLMTEALSMVLEYGFMVLGLHRIEAQRDCRNPSSGRVLEKCGLPQEGILYGRLRNKGEYIDVAMHGATDEAWRRFMGY